MNWLHDLRLVRMNLDDRTFHCKAHGLLPEDEAANVLSRSGFTVEFLESAKPDPDLVAKYDAINARANPECESLS